MQETGSFDYIVVGAGSRRLRARQPADRERPPSRAADRSRRRGSQSSGSTCRSATPSCSPTRGTTGCTIPSPSPSSAAAQIIQPRGKVMGGSSSINGLLYIRGQAEDFDHWRQLGNAGWSFDDVLPYFRRAEDQQRGEDELHGVGGPLAVRDVSEGASAVRCVHRRRASRPGLPRTDDFNGAEPGRRRLFPAHHAQGTALVDRARLSRAGAQAAQSRGRVERADHAHPVRRAPRGRRRVSQGRRDAHRARERRGDPRRAARSTRRNCCSSPASARPTCCGSTAST